MSHTAVNADPDALIQCPYDPVHMIAQKRMPYHLIKCRKNHDGRDYEQCPYDARHIVLKSEFQQHVMNCKMKSIVEPTLILDGSDESIDIPESRARTIGNVLSSEWDNEAPTLQHAAAANDTPRINTFMRTSTIPSPSNRTEPVMTSLGRGRGSTRPQVDAIYERSGSYAISNSFENTNSFSCPSPPPMSSLGRGKRTIQELPRPRRPHTYEMSDEYGKESRRLKKKLYEIDVLKQREDNGEVLEANQMEKIRRKEQFEDELRELEKKFQKFGKMNR